MGGIVQLIMRLVLRPLMRPFTRLVIGLIAIPFFRLVLRRVVRLHELDEELEKDLEQWFRGSVLLLFATANVEALIFDFLSPAYEWLWLGLRILLAIGVIEGMPDQALFAVIHPGPPKIVPGRGFWKEVWRRRKEVLKGLVCKQLSRSSPVFAILCVIVGGAMDDTKVDGAAAGTSGRPGQVSVIDNQLPTVAESANSDPDGAGEESNAPKRNPVTEVEIAVGWICYFIAITQYLIIGLVTSRDRALDVLSEFDRQVAKRRQELVEEFQLGESVAVQPRESPPPDASEATPPGPQAAGGSHQEAGDKQTL